MGYFKAQVFYHTLPDINSLKMQFVRRLRVLRRTLCVASWQVYLADGSNGKCTWQMAAMASVPGRWQQWQVYLADGSNALIVVENISKTSY
jgi:hypothetical protein